MAKSPQTLAASIRRLLSLAPPRALALLLTLLVLASLSESIGILLLVPLLHLLQAMPGEEQMWVTLLRPLFHALGVPLTLSSLLVIFLLLITLRNGLQTVREIFATHLRLQVVDALRHRCFAALLSAEWRWLMQGRKSDYATLLLTDVARVSAGLQFGFSLLASLITVLAYLVAAAALSWPMTALAVSGGIGVFWALSGARRKALALGQTLSGANRAMQAHVQESFAGIKLAKILGNESRHLTAFLQVSQHLREQQLHFVASSSISHALFQTGGAVLLVAYLYLGIAWWQTPVAELLILVLIFGRLIPIFAGAQQQYHHWLHALPALHELDHLLAECRVAAEPIAPTHLQVWSVQTAIELHAARVCYPERTQPALDAITLTLPLRTTTAIMGASGAGKSTLADVLMGLLTLDGGTLTVDGVPVVGAERLRWRRSVAYVPQEVFLFNDSIRNNLLWGNRVATESECHTALQQAAAEFVLALPQGLDTLVGDGGIRLSGGERQRLALARALLKRPALLILDEATSALDTENEARVRKAIESLHGDMTVVIIGHRVAALEHADQVIILDQGRIIAQGRWDEVRP